MSATATGNVHQAVVERLRLPGAPDEAKAKRKHRASWLDGVAVQRPARPATGAPTWLALPLADGVGPMRAPRRGRGADSRPGDAACVHALDAANSGSEEHWRQRHRELIEQASVQVLAERRIAAGYSVVNAKVSVGASRPCSGNSASSIFWRRSTGAPRRNCRGGRSVSG